MENTIQTHTYSLSKEADTEGLDLKAAETWIYPTNFPTRDYQYNIIQKALLKNTLVSLPTGLGKTFIAAVIMYNIYRWYPHGKIIFMAPTKPLVKQQIDACYNIMAIPPEVTAELTGAKVSSSRTNIWTEKRVFFVTPQVLQNDLNKIAELGPKIKCLVFDEAHKARGNHAYCEVIRRLLKQNHKNFRVLALSATPGGNVNDVLDVIQNLLISHLEFRTEESVDVQPYVFQRSLETVVVPLGEKLEEVKEEYLKILEQYAKTLIRYNVIQGNCGSLTKGKIFMVMKDFQNKNKGSNSSHYSEIMRCLNICVTLYHAYELLIGHGLRSFLSFYDEHIEKPLLRGNSQLRTILNNVREYLGPIPNIEVLPDGTYPEIPKDIIFGHPKYYKLRDVLVSHFTQADKNTRVIVFFEYRESVMEAHTLLLQSRPLIQPKIFLGQGSGITQKVQIGVVKAFREGRCNTLLSTCIGEEGLDVGEVDLIVCFDISNKSPIRMVQRMGRTGRKREGRILVLVTEGREQQTLKDCLIHKNNISTFVLGSKVLSTGMYPDSPRLIPQNLTPTCKKMFITVKKIVKKNSVKDMLYSMSSSSSSDPIFSQDVIILDTKERIPSTVMLFNKGQPMDEDIKDNTIFYKHIEKQRTFQNTHSIKHSKSTKILTELLGFADSKRFNIPTQVQSLTQGNSGKNLKQGDIRNMFSIKNSQRDFQATQVATTKVLEDISTQILIKNTDEQVDIAEFPSISKEVFPLISNYLFTQMETSSSKCKHCPGSFRCGDFAISTAPCLLTNIFNWVPSDEILDTISLDDIETFSKSLDPNYQSANKLEQSEFSQFLENTDLQILNDVNFTQLEKEAEIQKFESEKSFNFEAPKNYSNILSKFGDSIFKSQDPTQFKNKMDNCEVTKPTKISDESLLNFFMLDSWTDIFGTLSPNSSQETVIYSPVDGGDFCKSSKSPSPTFSLDERKRKQRILQKNQRSQKLQCSEMGNSLTKTTDTCQKQASEIDISELCDLSYFGISNSTTELCVNKKKVADIDQICDLSQFGITTDENFEQMKHNTLTEKDVNSESVRSLNKNVCSIKEDIKTADKHVSSDNELEWPTQLFKATGDHGYDCKNECNDLLNYSEGNVGKKGISYLTRQPEPPTKNKLDMDQTFVEMGFNLPTQRTNISTQNKFDIDRNSVDMDFNLPTQHTNISIQNKMHIDKNSVEMDFDLPTQRTNISTQNNLDLDKTSVEMDFDLPTQRTNITTQNKLEMDENSLEMDFDLPTQCTTITTQKKLDLDKTTVALPTQRKNTISQNKLDKDQNSVEMDFGLPTQRTNMSCYINQPKLNDFQNKTCENSEDFFAMLNQPENSIKSNTLKRKNCVHKSQEIEKEIECIDLSALSPIQTNEKTAVPYESQMPITQMLSLINKSSQKENLKDYENKQSESVSRLSTKKTKLKQENWVQKQSKIVPRREYDPYLFSIGSTSKKVKPVIPTEKGSTSSDEFEDSVFLKPDLSSIKPNKKSVKTKQRHKKMANSFLDVEAEVSENEDLFISEDETEGNDDCYDKSFVNDETQNCNTEMYAKYLQSVRSPVNPGRFKIPLKPSVNISNVYSQPPLTENDTYLEDSFCVDKDDTELSQQHDLSELEILEQILKQKKKRKKSNEKPLSKPKRRRVICFGSDDSD